MKSTPHKFAQRVALGLAVVLLTAATPSGLARASHAQEAGTPRPAAEQPPQPSPTPRLVAALEGYEGPSVISGRRVLAAFSPDGRRLVTGGTDKIAYPYEIPAR